MTLEPFKFSEPLSMGVELELQLVSLSDFDLDGNGIDTRTIWTGNVARQPMVRGRRIVVPEDGLPNADEVMARGVLLPLSHAIDDETLDFVLATLEEFLAGR